MFIKSTLSQVAPTLCEPYIEQARLVLQKQGHETVIFNIPWKNCHYWNFLGSYRIYKNFVYFSNAVSLEFFHVAT
jgi:hypothetical protein